MPARGALLLAAAAKRGLARTIAPTFGLMYGLVAILGLVDGSDVLGIIPVNAADNVLHLAPAALGVGAALLSRRRAIDPHGPSTAAGIQPSGGPLTPPRP